jgi:hypothetical protein
MSQVATHIAGALDLDVLIEALARKLMLEADDAREAGQELEEVPRAAEEGTE